MKKAYKVFVQNREDIDEMDAIDPELVPRLFGITDSLEIEQFMALVAIAKNDSFMDNPLFFEDLVLIINGIKPNMASYEGCRVDQMWYTFFVLKRIRPELKFNEITKGYIEFIHNQEGFYIYPKESGLVTPLRKYLRDILAKKGEDRFEDFDFIGREASKLTEIFSYMDRKAKEDEIS